MEKSVYEKTHELVAEKEKFSRRESDMTKTIIDLKQVIEMLKNDMTRFYGVGFKATLK